MTSGQGEGGGRWVSCPPPAPGSLRSRDAPLVPRGRPLPALSGRGGWQPLAASRPLRRRRGRGDWRGSAPAPRRARGRCSEKPGSGRTCWQPRRPAEGSAELWRLRTPR